MPRAGTRLTSARRCHSRRLPKQPRTSPASRRQSIREPKTTGRGREPRVPAPVPRTRIGRRHVPKAPRFSAPRLDRPPHPASSRNISVPISSQRTLSGSTPLAPPPSSAKPSPPLICAQIYREGCKSRICLAVQPFGPHSWEIQGLCPNLAGFAGKRSEPSRAPSRSGTPPKCIAI